MAKLTGGSTEFLDEEERLQPKVGEVTALPHSGERVNSNRKRLVYNNKFVIFTC